MALDRSVFLFRQLTCLLVPLKPYGIFDDAQLHTPALPSSGSLIALFFSFLVSLVVV